MFCVMRCSMFCLISAFFRWLKNREGKKRKSVPHTILRLNDFAERIIFFFLFRNIHVWLYGFFSQFLLLIWCSEIGYPTEAVSFSRFIFFCCWFSHSFKITFNDDTPSEKFTRKINNGNRVRRLWQHTGFFRRVHPAIWWCQPERISGNVKWKKKLNFENIWLHIWTGVERGFLFSALVGCHDTVIQF